MIKNIFSFAVLIFSVIFLFLYMKPLYDLTEKRRADIALLNEALGKANSVKSVIKETETILSDISSFERSRFDTFLPSTIDEIRFVNNIISITRARSVVAENIKIEKRSTDTSQESVSKDSLKGGLQKVFSLDKGGSSGVAPITSDTALGGVYVATPVSFSFIASYSTMLLLLDDMEKSLGLINVNSLSFKEYTDDGGSAKNSVPRYYVTINLETYSIK